MITTITEFHRVVREMTGNEYLATVRASSEDDGHIKYEAYTTKTSWISGITPEGVVEQVCMKYRNEVPPMDMVITNPPFEATVSTKKQESLSSAEKIDLDSLVDKFVDKHQSDTNPTQLRDDLPF